MIDTGAGVVDADYRGVIFVLLFNHSDKDFQGMLQLFTSYGQLLTGVTKVEEGDRIAQIIFEKICTPEVQEVDVSTSHLYSVGDVVTTIYMTGA
jgi:dUTP pyrophosphatase